MAAAGAAALPDRVAAFREEYRARLVRSRYRGRLHLLSSSGLCLAVIATSLALLEAPRPAEWLAVPLTFLYANLVEYFGHRGPMHHRVRWLGAVFERHTRQHHRFFTDTAMRCDGPADYRAVLFPVVLIVFYLMGFAVPAGLAFFALVSPNVGLLFVATATAYFLTYELLHFAYHAPEGSRLARSPLLASLRQHHTRHHCPQLMQRYNFNITFPIGDRLFGTLYRDRD